MPDESKHPEEELSPEDEPKIVIDDDWKEQVAKEKAAAADGAPADDSAEQPEEQPPQAAAQPSDQPADDVLSDQGDSAPPPPPASFDVLVTMLFTQAMATLGHLPNPATGKAEVNKPYAKHYIDTLEMLGEKTKGNLTDEEQKVLSDALHAMRMAYVDAKA